MEEEKKIKRASVPSAAGICATVALALLVVFLGIVVFKHSAAARFEEASRLAASLETPPQTVIPTQTPTPTPKPTETPAPTPTPIPEFKPYHTENTDPEKFIKSVGINVDGVTLADDEEFLLPEPIDFGYGYEYTDLNGVVTFRGNNFRDNAAYGYANLKNYKFGDSWYVSTGTLTSGDTTWTGSGWVGQPLMMKWPKELRQKMNMRDWAKAADELVEVIYATMDGNVYFLDLETGQKTRDNLNLGYTFKGAGALDPRGYPILYLGSGYDSNLGTSRVFIISLIDFKTMYTFGNVDSFSLRGTLSYFDASPLVDAETDQLIYPGENGILYIIKLNTEFDPEKGTVSIDPGSIVKWHYYGKRTSLSSYWVGMEDSPAIWQGYVFMADNGGNLMCLDLNTLELVWVQDTLDDTNGTPVISIEDGHPYIYIGTSFHLGWRGWGTCDVPIWKIDAENGEIVWQTEFSCHSESGVSGGIQSTVALGQHDLEGYVYVTVAKTKDEASGSLVCLDRDTGEIVWRHDSYYTWSSPVIVYNDDGTGTLLYCTYGSTMYLLNGKTGEVLDSFNMQGGAEASPAVYEDTVVIGTRQCRIWGVKLT